MANTFENEGIVYRIVKESPGPDEIIRGVWIRMCPEGKPDRVGEVISCREYWPIQGDGYGRDFRIDMLLNGKKSEPYWFCLSEEYCEIVAPATQRHESESLENASFTNRFHTSRIIVVCFDGTWNENETQNTNTHRLFEFVDKDCAIKNYYSGVGIGMRRVSHLLDGISGRGLFRTVRAAYTFIRGNYREDDRIFVFGFSRGAFAARHLAGMISRIGIVKRTEPGYDQYRYMLRAEEGANNAQADVHFLGLFDCVPGNQYYMSRDVGSGVNTTKLEPGIRNFAHAVSVDERRWSFKPLIFEPSTQKRFNQTRFPGFHSDVGGEGNPPLNDFALAWMLKEANECGLPLRQVQRLSFDPTQPGIRHEFPWTRFGIKCDRSSLPEMKVVNPVADPTQLSEWADGVTI